MLNAIVITIYEHTDPQRVFWVVLKNNSVAESAMEYASKGELQTTLDAAVTNARATMRERPRVAPDYLTM